MASNGLRILARPLDGKRRLNCTTAMRREHLLAPPANSGWCGRSTCHKRGPWQMAHSRKEVCVKASDITRVFAPPAPPRRFGIMVSVSLGTISHLSPCPNRAVHGDGDSSLLLPTVLCHILLSRHPTVSPSATTRQARWTSWKRCASASHFVMGKPFICAAHSIHHSRPRRHARYTASIFISDGWCTRRCWPR